MSVTWNLWHGCHRKSAGCLNCYVYRSDERHGRTPNIVTKTADFNLPVQRTRSGEYRVAPGEMVYTCFTSDFLVEDADIWRPDAWRMMRERSDLTFLFITKRIERLMDCVPPDWGDGYDNVRICCTMENQDRADYRLPLLKAAPIKYKGIICEPLLGPIDLRAGLGAWVDELVAGGESGSTARPCDYEWILDLRRQCMEQGIRFWFKQTGARFIKDGRLYRVPRRLQHSQARRAGINYIPPGQKPVPAPYGRDSEE